MPFYGTLAFVSTFIRYVLSSVAGAKAPQIGKDFTIDGLEDSVVANMCDDRQKG